MADTDFVGIERINGCGYKVSQFQPRSHEGGALAHLGRNLLDAVLRFFEVQQGAESLSFFQRMNILALQVFHDGHFDSLSVGEVDDANGNGWNLCNLRGTIPPCSGYDLETVL